MRLLVIGPDGREVATACAIAAGRGVEVRHRTAVEAAIDDLRAGRGADLIMIDADLDVVALVGTLTAERFWLPVVAFGIDADPRRVVAAIKAGAKEYMPLPPDPELMAAIIESIAAETRELVSEDPVMQAVLHLARQFSAADASVLVTGESGTGKEVIARFIHRHSRRRQGPFVSVNCAAIPEKLLESELFGHERGAFTGAIARRIGKFEEADGGTLLLDEISEIDPRLQAKLLRAIQEREIDRVGGSKPVKVDIRLLATSNRDLEKAVRDGSFREDLFFRLNVLELRLPPLRERPRDIEALAGFFAAKYARTNGLPRRALSESALARLQTCPWRGNVRELENCMHRAVLLASGSEIGADAILLSGGAAGSASQPARQAAAPAASGGAAAAVGRTIAEVECGLIIDTLRHTLGNRTHAATILGISIRTLRNKLKIYSDEGIAVPPPAGEPAVSA